MKTDKSYLFLLLVLIMLISLDVLLTYIGINLGYTEGNIFVLWAMNNYGVAPALWFASITSLSVVALLGFIRHKKESEGWTKFMYITTALLIAWRAFIVGAWWALISIKVM